MQSAPQTQVLSQALEAAIGEARVRVAVFVSFQLDPAFFERSILPLLFRRGFSDNEAVRRAQLDEALRELEHVAVYYDRSGLITENGPARLDYRRIGLSVPGASSWTRSATCPSRPTRSPTTRTRCSTPPTSCSSTR